jgi:hypothetical protein
MMRTISNILLIVLTLFLFGKSVLAYSSPGTPTGFVNDFANVLKPEEKAVARFEEWNDNPFQHTKKGFLDRLTAWMPEIFIIAISLISLYLIFCLIFLDKIWC